MRWWWRRGRWWRVARSASSTISLSTKFAGRFPAFIPKVGSAFCQGKIFFTHSSSQWDRRDFPLIILAARDKGDGRFVWNHPGPQ